MKKTKATEKEMYQLIAATMADNAEVVAFCENKIDALRRKAERAKERAREKRTENDAMGDAVYAVLDTEDYLSVSDILTAIAEDYEDATTSKVVSRLSKLYKANLIEKATAKVEKTETTPSRTITVYRKVVVD